MFARRLLKDDGLDNDAMAFARVANISSTELIAIDRLVKDFKTYGLWQKARAIYPMLGGTAASTAWNLKNLSAFNLVYSGGWTYSLTGITPDGSSGFANTGFIPSSNLELSDFASLSYYSRTNSAVATESCLSAQEASGALWALSARRTSDGWLSAFSNNLSSFVQSIGTNSTDGTGLFTATHDASTPYLYRNGINLAFNSRVAYTTGGLPTINIYLGARNQFGTAAQFTNKQCAYADISTGLTAIEVAVKYQIIQQFQAILGRAV